MPTKPSKPIYAWTKKIGPQHGSRSGESTTICGLPMLGNNYSRPAKSWPDSETVANPILAVGDFRRRDFARLRHDGRSVRA